VTDVSWSRCDGEDCLRLTGAGSSANVRVFPASAAAVDGLPPMAGRVVRDGDDVCFVPRFSFVAGTTYRVVVDGVAGATLLRPQPRRHATTEVVAIHPTTASVPRNLLRGYVSFSAPMREGCAATHVRLIDDAGDELVGGLLPTEHELWDPARRRLTVLLDPARIKRGLVPHRQAGYPLRAGGSFRLVVDEGFLDASGLPLRTGAERRYDVEGDERRRVDPGDWALAVPSCHTLDALEVAFGRPLDHALVARCLGVVMRDGRRIDGTPTLDPEQRSWRFVPRLPWAPGLHRLVVDRVLEDLAGNSVKRVFDRDLARPEDEPRDAGPVTVTFTPR
jgi:hypothetical protein